MSTVSIARCAGYEPDAVETAVRDALDRIGGIRSFVSPGARVLLKVNMLSRAEPNRAVTTHPEVLAAIIRLVREAGGVPTVADSPGGPNTVGQVRRVFQDTGIGAVCDATGVPLLLLDDDTVRVPNPDGALYGYFTLGKAVVDADVVITIPKFKTHGFMMFTGAVKNLFGCIPGLEKAQYHVKVPDRDDFASMLVDLMLVTKPKLAIMDAVVGMEGEGPAGGKARHIGAVLASADSVALDVIAAAMAGLDPMEVYTNRAAAARNLGPTTVDEIRVVGTDWRELAPSDFELPVRDLSSRMPAWLGRRLRSWLTARPVLEREQQCTRCGNCAKVCPVDAIHVDEAGPHFDRGLCIRCYCCQELCPPQAIGLAVPPLARLGSARR